MLLLSKRGLGHTALCTLRRINAAPVLTAVPEAGRGAMHSTAAISLGAAAPAPLPVLRGAGCAEGARPIMTTACTARGSGSQADRDNRSNQLNPNSPIHEGGSTTYQGDRSKDALDNHANQMNPNNPAFHSSRGGGGKHGGSGGGKGGGSRGGGGGRRR